MWIRTQLKIGGRDLLAGGLACLVSRDRTALAARAEAYWGDDDVIAAYSVRSGFDLALRALGLEPGDEVIFSALNVKGMVRIVDEHGLVPVPLDLDIARMSPSADALEQAISPRTKVLVVAHLFGSRIDLGPLFAVARKHGLIIVEDCAQAFCGRGYRGHPDADLSMFSFGPLKTATALGGALIRVHDPALRARMRVIQSTYPVQPTTAQLKRIATFVALKLVTSRPVMAATYRLCRAKGTGYEDALADSVRSVAPLKSAKRLRFQPSAAMLALMNRRLYGFDDATLASRTVKGRRLVELLDDSVVMPGQGNGYHDYWVFPILAERPDAAINTLRAAGFDAARLPRSRAVAAPEDRPWLAPQRAAQALADLVILPCYPRMPDRELVRLADVVRALAAETGTTRTRSYSGELPAGPSVATA